MVLGIALLMAAILLSGCGVWLASVSVTVTVTNEDGLPLSDISVSAFDQSTKTDAEGTAILKRVPCGPLTLRFSGQGYSDLLRIVAQTGHNRVDYRLLPMMGIWPPEPLDRILAVRVRVRQALDSSAPVTEGTLVRGRGGHWKLPDGRSSLSVGRSTSS